MLFPAATTAGAITAGKRVSLLMLLRTTRLAGATSTGKRSGYLLYAMRIHQPAVDIVYQQPEDAYGLLIGFFF